MEGSAADRLGKRMGQPAIGIEDWDLILANGSEVDSYCTLYESGGLPDDEKELLMWLVVASLDRLLGEDPSSPMQERVNAILKQDCRLHRDVINYWAAATRAEPVWDVTPMMRRLLDSK